MFEIPFNSTNKFQMSIHALPSEAPQLKLSEDNDDEPPRHLRQSVWGSRQSSRQRAKSTKGRRSTRYMSAIVSVEIVYTLVTIGWTVPHMIS